MNNLQNSDGVVGVLERLEAHHRELKRLRKQLQKERPTEETTDRYYQVYIAFLDDVKIFLDGMDKLELTEKQIDCLMKRYIRGDTWKQIGQYLNITTSAAIKLGVRSKREFYYQKKSPLQNKEAFYRKHEIMADFLYQ